MTKQEVIENAWKSLIDVEVFEDYITSEGFIEKEVIPSVLCDFEICHSQGKKFVRPKTLMGISDNNGWTKIETENDLPKVAGDYLFNHKYGDRPHRDVYFHPNEDLKFTLVECFSHWRPIIQILNPLY